MKLNDLKEAFAEDPETLLDALGLDSKLMSGRANILCPFHNDRNMGSAIIRNGVFICFSCGARGDVIELTEQAANVGFREAVSIASDAYGISVVHEKCDKVTQNLKLSKKEREALDFPKTAIGVGQVMRTDADLYKKIVLVQAARKISEYRILDRLYGSDDVQYAYVIAEYVDFNDRTFSDIHRVLESRINVLMDLEKRL